MHSSLLPPEVNSGRIYAGPGVAPMLTAASAWDDVANELHNAADDVELVVSGLASGSWQGPAAEAPEPQAAAHEPSAPKGATSVSAEMGESGSPGRLSVPQALSKLADLRDNGALTQQELNEEKHRLLGR